MWFFMKTICPTATTNEWTDFAKVKSLQNPRGGAFTRLWKPKMDN